MVIGLILVILIWLSMDGGVDGSDVFGVSMGFLGLIPEATFWVYTAWVWFKGTFGHWIVWSIATTYLWVVIGFMIVILLWISFIMNGKMIMWGRGAMGKFEKTIQASIILVFPIVLVTIFHKAIFGVYYCKYYYWDNKDKASRKKAMDARETKPISQQQYVQPIN